jgi:thiol-disulfide isomerase/thioredoxin
MLLAAIAVIATVVWLARGDVGRSVSAAGTSGPAPAFDLENVVDGQAPVGLADYRRLAVVVVNFWALWCAVPQLLSDTVDGDGGDTFDEHGSWCFVLIHDVAEPACGRAEVTVVVSAHPTNALVAGQGSRRG